MNTVRRTLFIGSACRQSMVGFAFGNDAQEVNENYHRARQEALKNTVSLDVWGEMDIEKYDLDKLPSTLGGPMYERQYLRIPDEGETEADGTYDIRKFPTLE